MSDTTTTLNAGSGGDSMDESLATQSDGITTAKRPRVVLGGDTGYTSANGVNDIVQPVNSDPGNSPMALPTIALGLVDDTPSVYLVGQTRAISLTTEGRIRVASIQATVYLDMFGDTGPIETDPYDFINCPVNPFGI
jgi:hypothetical protein